HREDLVRLLAVGLDLRQHRSDPARVRTLSPAAGSDRADDHVAGAAVRAAGGRAATANAAVLLPPETTRPKQGHDVLQPVADTPSAIGILGLNTRLLLAHRLLDHLGDVGAELLRPDKPGVTLED